MIRINLLPHREEKRKLKKNAFFALLALAGILGVGVVLIVGGYNQSRISIQEARNNEIKKANVVLDNKIAEIAKLKDEIESLRARQQAVEDLQSDRNQPVHLLDELVRLTPDGVYLKSFKQDTQTVAINGYAQSQERVADYLRRLAGESQWLEKPELGDVQAAAVPGSKSAAKRIVEFTMRVTIKRTRKDEAGAKGKPGAAAAASGKAST